jgi:hypothetical protein
MLDRSDHLLNAISSRGSVSWQAFKDIYYEVKSALSGANGISQPARRYEVSVCARRLQSLGHCDCDFSGSGTVYAAPPVLARLPFSGRVLAVLAGARTAAQIEAFAAAAKREGAELSIRHADVAAIGVPSRIIVECASPSALSQLAANTNTHYTEEPAAWQIASYAGSVGEYVESLEWLPATDPRWDESGFNPDKLSFTGFYDQSDSLRLTRQEVYGRWVFALWRGGMRANANVDWARYAVANLRGTRLMAYDPRNSIFAAASGAPIPSPLARALVLCSGQLPEAASSIKLTPREAALRNCDCYHNVPKPIADLVFAKLRQSPQIAALAT